MSRTTVSIELNDNQARIRGTDINGLSIRGGHNYIYIYIYIDHNWI